MARTSGIDVEGFPEGGGAGDRDSIELHANPPALFSYSIVGPTGSLQVGRFVCCIPNGAPANARFEAQKLPRGLTIDAGSGVIVGVPRVPTKLTRYVVSAISTSEADKVLMISDMWVNVIRGDGIQGVFASSPADLDLLREQKISTARATNRSVRFAKPNNGTPGNDHDPSSSGSQVLSNNSETDKHSREQLISPPSTANYYTEVERTPSVANVESQQSRRPSSSDLETGWPSERQSPLQTTAPNFEKPPLSLHDYEADVQSSTIHEPSNFDAFITLGPQNWAYDFQRSRGVRQAAVVFQGQFVTIEPTETKKLEHFAAVSQLPEGLHLDQKTGAISGIPTASGSSTCYQCHIQAMFKSSSQAAVVRVTTEIYLTALAVNDQPRQELNCISKDARTGTATFRGSDSPVRRRQSSSIVSQKSSACANARAVPSRDDAGGSCEDSRGHNTLVYAGSPMLIHAGAKSRHMSPKSTSSSQINFDDPDNLRPWALRQPGAEPRTRQTSRLAYPLVNYDVQSENDIRPQRRSESPQRCRRSRTSGSQTTGTPRARPPVPPPAIRKARQAYDMRSQTPRKSQSPRRSISSISKYFGTSANGCQPLRTTSMT